MQINEYPERYDLLSDEELVRLCRKGEQEAFGELSVRYIFVIRNKASEFYSAGLEIDDLFQEGLIGLHNAVRTYNEEEGATFRTYASVCINNRLVSAVRAANSSKNKINHYAVSLSEQLDTPSAPDTEPENALVAVEALSELWDKIRGNLSEKELRVLTMYLDGRSYDQISQVLGISRKSCDNAMQRVRKKLRILK